MTRQVLGKTFLVLTLSSLSATASDLWQYSLPVFDSLNASSVSGVSSAAAWGGSAQVSSSADSWFSNSTWGGGSAVSTASSSQAVLADDVFRSALYGGSSNAVSATSSSSASAPWFSNLFSGSSSSNSVTTASSTGSWWQTSDWGSSSSSSSVVSNTSSTGAWWQGAWGSSSSVASSSSVDSAGGWFGSWRTSLGGAASSDMTACNMVSSWAAAPVSTSGWDPNSWGGLAAFSAPAAAPVASSGCNQTQASTVGNLATLPQNGQLPGLGTPLDQIVIGDVTETPEPSTVVMVGCGLGLAAYLRRRRTEAKA